MQTATLIVEKVVVVTRDVVLRVPVPRIVVPSLNVTVPVGVPAPGLETLTVAVNVTDWPNKIGRGVGRGRVVVAGVAAVLGKKGEGVPAALVARPENGAVEGMPG